MNAVDTNILIYVHDDRDPVKQTTAETLVRTLPDELLLRHVACEYIAASRKLEAYGYSREKAWQDLHKMRSLWTSQLPTWEVLLRAEELSPASGRAAVAFTLLTCAQMQNSSQPLAISYQLLL